MKIEMVDLSALIPYVRNARKHSDEQIKRIAKSIADFGFNVPLVIDSKNEIIAGHGRFLAAKQAGLTAVPCVCLSHLDEEQIRTFRLLDNRLAEESTWDEKLLSSEVETLNLDFQSWFQEVNDLPPVLDDFVVDDYLPDSECHCLSIVGDDDSILALLARLGLPAKSKRIEVKIILACLS